jgi:hypothetical protein
MKGQVSLTRRDMSLLGTKGQDTSSLYREVSLSPRPEAKRGRDNHPLAGGDIMLTNDTNTGVITVTLNRTNVYTRWPCLCCGHHSEKDAILADVFEDGEPTGLVVCTRCLADPDVRETMRQTAARTRQHADWLAAVAEHLPALPTLAEWTAATEAENQRALVADAWDRASAQSSDLVC